MANGEPTEIVKEEEKPQGDEAFTPAAVPAGMRAVVAGQVIVVVQPNGSIAVNSPPDVLMALAILRAGEAFLEMKLMDGMRQNAALQPPKIIAAGADALKHLDKRNGRGA